MYLFLLEDELPVTATLFARFLIHSFAFVHRSLSALHLAALQTSPLRCDHQMLECLFLTLLTILLMIAVLF